LLKVGGRPCHTGGPSADFDKHIAPFANSYNSNITKEAENTKDLKGKLAVLCPWNASFSSA